MRAAAAWQRGGMRGVAVWREAATPVTPARPMPLPRPPSPRQCLWTKQRALGLVLRRITGRAAFSSQHGPERAPSDATALAAPRRSSLSAGRTGPPAAARPPPPPPPCAAARMAHRLPGNRPEMPTVSAEQARRVRRALRRRAVPPAHTCAAPPAATPNQVADETRAEFSKGLAEAFKRKMEKKEQVGDWEQRLEAAAAAEAAKGVSPARDRPPRLGGACACASQQPWPPPLSCGLRECACACLRTAARRTCPPARALR